MKTLALVLSTLLISFSALAETTTYPIKGMHCGSCKKAIESKLCKMEGLQTCKVEVLDGKKEIGQVTISTKDGSAPDFAKMSEAVKAAGEYELQQPEKK